MDIVTASQMNSNPLTLSKWIGSRRVFSIPMKSRYFLQGCESYSSCCLCSFNCKSHWSPYGSLQEMSTRVKRETSPHGDAGALWKVRWSSWGLILENEPKPQHIPLLRIIDHPTHRAHCGWLKTTEKGFIMESHIVAEFFDYSWPSSSGLGKSRLKPY